MPRLLPVALLLAWALFSPLAGQPNSVFPAKAALAAAQSSRSDHFGAPESGGLYPGAAGFRPAPLLTIVYAAETRGEAYPCASCGGKIGGLARRAGLVAQLREQADRAASPLLLLLGPGEFAADRPEAAAQAGARRSEAWRLSEEAPLSPAASLAVYAALSPQAVYLSPEAGRWIRMALMKIPTSFVPVNGIDGRAESRVFEYGGRKVGVVFFAAAADEATARQARAGALFAGRALAGRVHLLIGVSPWGFAAEKDFLPEAAGLFHILLGGGSGPGFAEAASAHSGRLLWSRPAAAGAGLNVIYLYRWPDAPPFWENALTHEARQEILGPGIAEDPATARLLLLDAPPD